MRSWFYALATVGTLAAAPACAPALQVAQAIANPEAALARAAQGCTQVQNYTPGTVIEGEFTASDCYTVDYDGTRQPLDQYQIRVETQRDIHAIVEAPGLDVMLALVNDEGAEIKADPYMGEFTFVATQVPAGTYRLMVTSRRPGASTSRVYGRYRLRSSTDQVGFEGCPVLQDVQLGATVQGEWSVSDCELPVLDRFTIRYFDFYLLNVPREREVGITLESPGINSDVALFTRDGAPLEQADAYGRPGRFTRALAPGTYVIRVGIATASDRETGRYTLRVR